VLFREGQEGELQRFARSRLGPLLRVRNPQRRELLRTLRAYFESGMSASRSAAALHVHVNTVYYRLERLRGLLGPGFVEPLRALDLQIALLAQRLSGEDLEEPSEAEAENPDEIP
jgi:DNA-binding PucR family transcriptional regulator